MTLTRVQRLILYSLGQFYRALNQPLIETLLELETQKITFIEHLKKSSVISKQERSIYRNLETLEQKKMITYDNHMIKFTKLGLDELEKINSEISQILQIQKYFQQAEKPKRKLQTVIKS